MFKRVFGVMKVFMEFLVVIFGNEGVVDFGFLWFGIWFGVKGMGF